ncbi:tetratricopeptide repeat protein [Chitinophaga solisilvae]|uniref:tetratricopeptide repeat protein n=1 Tax=Chitinophaga solisilvae TaxID=1233460 RepID=UPI00136A8406|nr:tetratricopeptide repeat protein [Chitinophaga solisilvae]
MFFFGCNAPVQDKTRHTLQVLTDSLDNNSIPLQRKITLALYADSLAATSGFDSLHQDFQRRTGVLYYDLGEATQAKNHFLQATTIARRLKDSLQLAIALNNTGIAYDELQEKDSALTYYISSNNIFRLIKDSVHLAQGLINIGILYKNDGDYKKALDANFEAALLLELSPDKRSLSDAYSNIGNNLKDLRQYAKAFDYHQKALAIRTNEKDSTGMAGSLNNIGNIYRYQRKYPEALEQYQLSLAIKKKTGTPRSIATSLDNIASVYLQLQAYAEAGAYYRQALAISRKSGDKEGAANTINHLCELLLATGDVKGAENLAGEAGVLLQEQPYSKNKLHHLGILSTIHQRTGRYKTALQYAQLQLSLKDSLYAHTGLTRTATDMEARYDTQQKLMTANQLAARQTSRIKIQQVYISVLAILLITLVITAVQLKLAKQNVEGLFKELNHRVKNSMQLLISIINLQKARIQDPARLQLLDAIQDRVFAIKDVHESLQYKSRPSSTRMQPFIHDLVDKINISHAEKSARFNIIVTVADIYLPVNTAVTTGLIINEAMTNIYKHGQLLHDHGEIRITLEALNNRYKLCISDNCAPWKAAPGTQGMGLILLNLMSKQIPGKMTISSNDTGSVTVVTF